MWGKPRAEDGRAYVGTRAPTCYSSSSLGLAVKSPWPRQPQARAHRPRRSCLLVSSLRMRSTAVGVRMRAALPRARVRTWHLRLAAMARERTFERWPVERVRRPAVQALHVFTMSFTAGRELRRARRARREFKCRRSMVRTNRRKRATRSPNATRAVMQRAFAQ